MQLQAPKENHSHGYHSPNSRAEPIGREESDSSSFNFTANEFFAHGSTYGKYSYTLGYSPNTDYRDASLYGPGQDSPLSSYYAFKKRLPSIGNY